MPSPPGLDSAIRPCLANRTEVELGINQQAYLHDSHVGCASEATASPPNRATKVRLLTELSMMPS